MNPEPEQLTSFRRAGIPMRYHGQAHALSKLGTPLAVRLAAWVENAVERDTHLGMGHGMTILNDDAVFYLLARGLVLRGKQVKVASLDTFFRGGEDNQPSQIHAEVECLFLTGLYDPAYPDAFTNAERYRIQWLLRDRMDRGLPTFFLLPQPIMSCSQWWAPAFLKLISELSPEQA